MLMVNPLTNTLYSSRYNILLFLQVLAEVVYSSTGDVDLAVAAAKVSGKGSCLNQDVLMSFSCVFTHCLLMLHIPLFRMLLKKDHGDE